MGLLPEHIATPRASMCCTFIGKINNYSGNSIGRFYDVFGGNFLKYSQSVRGQMKNIETLAPVLQWRD
ncbi:hypothetical protein U1Q18_005204, partial [Sarracenia purpurea var. burkii]